MLVPAGRGVGPATTAQFELTLVEMLLKLAPLLLGGRSVFFLRTTDTPMGKMVTTLTVTNHSDQIAVERSSRAPEGVRSVTLDNVPVDSGATTTKGTPA